MTDEADQTESTDSESLNEYGLSGAGDRLKADVEDDAEDGAPQSQTDGDLSETSESTVRDTAVDSRNETEQTSAQEQTAPTHDEREASPQSDGEPEEDSPAETDSEHTRATATAGSQDGRLHSTDGDAVNSPQSTLRSRRSSVREFRTATELLLREPLKQRERERHQQVGAQFTESVHLTDFREAVYRAGLDNVEGIQQALFEMGYRRTDTDQLLRHLLEESDIDTAAVDTGSLGPRSRAASEDSDAPRE